MSFKTQLTHNFQKQAKHLLKKYPSLKHELAQLRDQLLQNPHLGTPIGSDCYKIRVAIKSKGKGKSGGARVITHVYVAGKTIYLLSIYDKSEQDSVSDKEIKELLKYIVK